MSLGEAITRLGTLYKQEGRAKFDAKSAVSAWGYGSLNGASLRALSALKQYGFLEGGNEELRISGRGLTILLEPESSPEYTEALRGALETPALFQEMLTEYGDSLPSDGAIVSYLVRKQDFGEPAAKSLISSFRESVELVRSKDASYLVGGARHNAIDTRRVEEPAKPMPAKDIEQQSTGKVLNFTYTMSGDTAAVVTITGKLPTVKNVARLLKWLDLVKDEIEEAASEAAAEEAAVLTDFSFE